MNTPINTSQFTYETPNVVSSGIPQPLTKEEEQDLLSLDTMTPPPLVRQTNTPRYLTYENGILVDQYGNSTTPEQHNTTHAEILKYIHKHRQWCRIEDDDEFRALVAKYLPQVIQVQQVRSEERTKDLEDSPKMVYHRRRIEMPKLERTNRPKVDLGLPPLEEG
jgi:hypothetical protein